MKTNLIQLTRIVFLIFVSFCFVGCREKDPAKDEVDDTANDFFADARVETLITDVLITTNLVITTVNEQGEFVGNVKLEVGIDNEFTDDKGRVIIENIEVNEDFVMIKASKDGYEINKKTITPSKNGLTIVEIMLMVDQPSQSLSSARGGQLTFGSVKLDFPKNAIITADGLEYTGNVNVNTVYHDPQNENFASTQPGTLVGVTNGDELTALISEGMITVDLTDNAGNSLNVSSDSKVKVTLPASTTGPVTIPLWHMNEKYGVWVEAGIAIKVGDVYEFEVTHFSSYNLDWKVDPIDEFCVTFKDETGKLITNQKIDVRYLTSGRRSITTDIKGQICFRNAPATSYEFLLNFRCEEQPTGSLSITGPGEYNVYIDLNNTSITYFDFSGTLSFCDGQLAKSKSFTIELLDQEKYLFGYSDFDGDYSIQSLLCDVTPEIYPARVHVLDGGFYKVNDFDVDLTESEFTLNINSCGLLIPISNEEVISIPDWSLSSEIRSELNLDSSIVIKYKHLLLLDNLFTVDASVRNLEGIQYCTNLSSFTLAFPTGIGTGIENFNLLSSLNKLAGLNLAGCRVTELNFLEGLDNLVFLVLNHNRITDLGPLYRLTNLVQLDLENNSPAFTQSQKDELINALPNTTINF